MADSLNNRRKNNTVTTKKLERRVVLEQFMQPKLYRTLREVY
jgi:hypothetical protein